MLAQSQWHSVGHWNILVTYIKQPNINGFRSLLERAISEVQSDQIGLVECHIADVEEVAKKLLVQGIDINVIIQATGLTIDEIKEL